MSDIARKAALIGIFAAAPLVLVGVVTAVFSVPYLAQLTGLDGPAIKLLILSSVAILHALPFALFIGARWGTAGPRWYSFMLAIAPVVVWPGASALLFGNDWGDVFLWGPYLATGLCLFACGLSGLLWSKS